MNFTEIKVISTRKKKKKIKNFVNEKSGGVFIFLDRLGQTILNICMGGNVGEEKKKKSYLAS